MDDRGRSRFNCDVSACLWQTPPAASGDGQECVSSVREETAEVT